MNNRERYADNWEDTIRPNILKRDKYACRCCGLKHRKIYVFPKKERAFVILASEMEEFKTNGLKVYKVFLQVAHLDHNPDNNNPSNLKAMCPKCHLNFDRYMNILLRKKNAKRRLK